MAEIEKLSELAALNNAKENITGLLIREKTGFVQYLEGNKTKVVMLYEKLLRDNRHHSLTVLDRGVITVRRFRGWSMMLKYISPSELKLFSLKKNLKFDTSNESSDGINKELAHLLVEEYQTSA